MWSLPLKDFAHIRQMHFYAMFVLILRKTHLFKVTSRFEFLDCYTTQLNDMKN